MLIPDAEQDVLEGILRAPDAVARLMSKDIGRNATRGSIAPNVGNAVPSGNAGHTSVLELAMTVPIVMPEVQGDVPPESVTFPATLEAQTVSPTVVVELALMGISEGVVATLT
jgi:hypothetical protein